MIKSIYVQNFMRIDKRVELPLSPITILVGGNGSGKSSILKALHWSVRCATLKDHRGNASLEQMDYTPSRAFQELAHKKRLQNKSDLPKIIVGFVDDKGDDTEIAISAARNDAGAKAEISGPLTSALTSEQATTAYIPGIAGLAEFETVLATPVLSRRAASGEGGSVLRHILLDLVGGSAGTDTEYVELSELSSWVSKVLPGSQFWVKFDRLRDARIDALFLTPNMKEPGRADALQRRPLEMAGTGYLQIVQIFAYLLKFNPKLLLIDEPDAHLHPSTQEALIKALEEASLSFPQTKFIVTTHSPHLVRACGPQTSVHWMDDGALRTDSEERIRLRMGWGALDKELLLFTEDGNLTAIKALLSQWPDLERKVLLWPTFGYSGIPSGRALKQLREELGIPIMVHRDRDFMSDADVDAWEEKKELVKYDIPLWVTPGSDIESCFCTVQHIAEAIGILASTSERILAKAVRSFDSKEMQTDFESALSAAINILPATSRSSIIDRWSELKGPSPDVIKGKILLKAIEKAISAELLELGENRKLSKLSDLRRPIKGIELATNLKNELLQLLDK
ncbi:ATP-dependent nuclease [Sphingomonas kyungheensis]|uniref:AAA family ATPase n=1 Tax=Sphingomonas kyungheensis TaxID=1069987 RepID=A0ABU8H6P5_9SPHN